MYLLQYDKRSIKTLKISNFKDKQIIKVKNNSKQNIWKLLILTNNERNDS